MTFAEIKNMWLSNKKGILLSELVPVDREEDGPFQLSEEDLTKWKEYKWYECPNNNDHLCSVSLFTFEGEDKYSKSQSWGDILTCSICDCQWIVSKDVATIIRIEEERVLANLARFSDKLTKKYKKEDIDGKTLSFLRHSWGIHPDVVQDVFDCQFSDEIMADYEKEWKIHCAKGK